MILKTPVKIRKRHPIVYVCLLIGVYFNAWSYFEEHHKIALSQFLLWCIRVGSTDVVVRSLWWQLIGDSIVLSIL